MEPVTPHAHTHSHKHGHPRTHARAYMNVLRHAQSCAGACVRVRKHTCTQAQQTIKRALGVCRSEGGLCERTRSTRLRQPAMQQQNNAGLGMAVQGQHGPSYATTLAAITASHARITMYDISTLVRTWAMTSQCLQKCLAKAALIHSHSAIHAQCLCSPQRHLSVAHKCVCREWRIRALQHLTHVKFHRIMHSLNVSNRRILPPWCTPCDTYGGISVC